METLRDRENELMAAVIELEDIGKQFKEEQGLLQGEVDAKKESLNRALAKVDELSRDFAGRESHLRDEMIFNQDRVRRLSDEARRLNHENSWLVRQAESLSNDNERLVCIKDNLLSESQFVRGEKQQLVERKEELLEENRRLVEGQDREERLKYEAMFEKLEMEIINEDLTRELEEFNSRVSIVTVALTIGKVFL